MKRKDTDRAVKWLPLIAALLAAAPVPIAAQGRPITAAQVDQMMRNTAPFREMFEALRTHYPTQYRAAIDRIVTSIRTNPDPAAAGSAGFAFMREFMASKVDSLSAAPEADLAALATAYSGLADSLAASNVALCAQWSMVGFGPATVPSADALQRLVSINAAQIRAMRNGETSGAAPRGPIEAADMQAIGARMRAIDPEAADLMGRGGLASATPALQCRGGQALYRAIAQLEPSRSARVTAHLLRQYFLVTPPPATPR
jgi:hypothetical protein